MKIRKYLLSFVIIINFFNCYKAGENEPVRLIQKINRLINTFGLDFFSNVKIKTVMIERTSALNDIKTHIQDVSDIINCNTVFKKMKLSCWNG